MLSLPLFRNIYLLTIYFTKWNSFSTFKKKSVLSTFQYFISNIYPKKKYAKNLKEVTRRFC